MGPTPKDRCIYVKGNAHDKNGMASLAEFLVINIFWMKSYDDVHTVLLILYLHMKTYENFMMYPVHNSTVFMGSMYQRIHASEKLLLSALKRKRSSSKPSVLRFACWMVGKEVKHVSQTGDLLVSHETDHEIELSTSRLVHPFVWETLSIGMVGMLPKTNLSPPYLTMNKKRNYSKPWLLALANLKLLEAAERHPFGTANCGVCFFWGKWVLMFRMLMQKYFQIFEPCLIDMEI